MSKPEWIRLPEADRRQQDHFRGLLSVPMIQNSVLSGEVPVRAIDYHSTNHMASVIHIPIEKQIRSGMQVDVLQSLITDEFGKWLWWQVEIHWLKCLDYCKQYLVPAWYVPSKGDLSTKKPSGRPTRKRAEQALKEIYGDQIPDQTSVPNKVLSHEVHKWLKNKNLPDVSSTTILRAAGRRD
jgi:hypothetical protein